MPQSGLRRRLTAVQTQRNPCPFPCEPVESTEAVEEDLPPAAAACDMARLFEPQVSGAALQASVCICVRLPAEPSLSRSCGLQHTMSGGLR